MHSSADKLFILAFMRAPCCKPARDRILGVCPGSDGYLYLPLALYITGGGTPLSLFLAFSLSSVFCRKSESLRTQFSWLQPHLKELVLFIYLFIHAKGLQQRKPKVLLSPPPPLPHLTILLCVPNTNISAVKRRDQNCLSVSQFADQFITKREASGRIGKDETETKAFFMLKNDTYIYKQWLLTGI